VSLLRKKTIAIDEISFEVAELNCEQAEEFFDNQRALIESDEFKNAAPTVQARLWINKVVYPIVAHGMNNASANGDNRATQSLETADTVKAKIGPVAAQKIKDALWQMAGIGESKSGETVAP